MIGKLNKAGLLSWLSLTSWLGLASCDTALKVKTSVGSSIPGETQSNEDNAFRILNEPGVSSNPNPELIWTQLTQDNFSLTNLRYLVLIAEDPQCQNKLFSFEDIQEDKKPLSFLNDGGYHFCVFAVTSKGSLVPAENNGLQIIFDRTNPSFVGDSYLETNKKFVSDLIVEDTTATTLIWETLSGPGQVSFSDPAQLKTNISMSSEGLYELKLSATDQAGNSNSQKLTVKWDLTPPQVELGPAIIASSASKLIQPTVDDANANFTWQTISGPSNATIIFDNPKIKNATLSSTQDGTYVVRLVAMDPAGNTGSDDLTITFDNNPPVVTIDALPGISSSNQTSFNVSGSCSEVGQPVVIGGAVADSVMCLAGVWLKTFDFSGIADGPVLITANHQDASAQAAPQASKTITKDTAAPSAATGLGWVESSPYNTINVTASWTKSASGDLASQSIQYYSDASCSTTVGSAVAKVAAAQSDSFAGVNGNSYYFKITTTDIAGNSSASSCSAAMVIDTAAPSAATGLGWVESSPHNATGVTASWTKSVSGDVASQSIQYYSNASCSTTVGSAIAKGAAAQSDSFTGSTGNSYYFKIATTDIAGNSSTSSCSVAMAIDTAGPSAATGLGWVESSPHNATGVTASWTKSVSGDVTSQSIQYYSDVSCSTTVGSAIAKSAAAQSDSFAGANGNSYYFKITSTDTVGNSAASACSTAMAIDTTAPVAANDLGWVESSPYNATSVTANWTKSASGDVASQSIQYYSDASCSTTEGSAIAKSAAAQSDGFTGSSGNSYYFKITSADAAGNSAASACSAAMAIDTTAPSAAAGLGWVESSPHNATSVTASWTKSASGDVASQSIQYYSDASCSTTVGSAIAKSAAAQSDGFTGSSGNSY